MDGMLWGPGAQAELAYRRERIAGLMGDGARGRRPVPAGAGEPGRGWRRRPARAARRSQATPERGWALPGSEAWPAA
jgi:hypothetical protein